MRPALNNLLTVGQGITEWLAEFIEQNPLIIKLITAVVVGIGTLAAGVAAYTVAVKIATAVQTAFNGALAASPIGWILMAIGAAVGVFALLASSIEESEYSVKNLTGATREAGKAFEEANEQYNQTAKAIEVTAGVADTLIGKLEALEAQGELTNEQLALS